MAKNGVKELFFKLHEDGSVEAITDHAGQSIRDLTILPRWLCTRPTSEDFEAWGRSIPGTQLVDYDGEYGSCHDWLIEALHDEFGQGEITRWGFHKHTTRLEKMDAGDRCRKMMRENRETTWRFEAQCGSSESTRG